MKFKMKKIIIALICIILIGVIAIVVYYQNASNTYQVGNINSGVNKIENIIDTINKTESEIQNAEKIEAMEKEDDEVVETTNEENTNIESNNETETNNNSTTSNSQKYIGEEETSVENTSISNDEKAINLVKKEWGEDDTVYYNIAYINGKIYNISVNSKDTTGVLAWYSVNIETEEVVEN